MQTASLNRLPGATYMLSSNQRVVVKRRSLPKCCVKRKNVSRITASGFRSSPDSRPSHTAPKSLALDAGVVTEEDVPGTKKKIAMRIDNVWYDCTGWAKAHPGGARFVEYFHGRDATDAFYALHSYGPNGSDVALKRLQKLPKCEAPEGANLPEKVNAKTAAACEDFREFRVKLEEDGWFQRNPLQEAKHIAQTIVPYILGTALAFSHPVAATLLLGLGMQQAGWLTHDFLHGRGKYCDAMECLGPLLNGFNSHWWIQKHSMHHIFTNEHNKDEDITMEPVFYLEKPEKTGTPDSPARQWQHVYGYPMYLVTYMLWRFDSLRTAVRRRDMKELAMIAINYCWLAYLPWQVALGSVAVGGFMVGALVSATHQSEEIMFEQGEFVDVQFRSTRDAEVKNPIARYLWGGMDTQLEHHLFPTMPRYKYHKLRPILQAFCEKSGFGYRISPDSKIISDNWNTLKEMASP